MRSLGDMLADIGVPPEASQQILTLRAGGHAQQACSKTFMEQAQLRDKIHSLHLDRAPYFHSPNEYFAAAQHTTDT
eukprot:m.98558 g.98558  ORF g.98558 m.98558 type:complete len:76 (+) comp16752_c0_seq1:521-748(+)